MATIDKDMLREAISSGLLYELEDRLWMHPSVLTARATYRVFQSNVSLTSEQVISRVKLSRARTVSENTVYGYLAALHELGALSREAFVDPNTKIRQFLYSLPVANP